MKNKKGKYDHKDDAMDNELTLDMEGDEIEEQEEHYLYDASVVIKHEIPYDGFGCRIWVNGVEVVIKWIEVEVEVEKHPIVRFNAAVDDRRDFLPLHVVSADSEFVFFEVECQEFEMDFCDVKVKCRLDGEEPIETDYQHISIKTDKGEWMPRATAIYVRFEEGSLPEVHLSFLAKCH